MERKGGGNGLLCETIGKEVLGWVGRGIFFLIVRLRPTSSSPGRSSSIVTALHRNITRVFLGFLILSGVNVKIVYIIDRYF